MTGGTDITYLIERYPKLSVIESEIAKAYQMLERAFEKGRKLLVAGNGGSAADAEHIAGELMKRFRVARPVPSAFSKKLREVDEERAEYLSKSLECSLRTIPLVAHEALTTAFMNDVDAYGVFAQQLYGYGDEGDVFLAISTSGNSENIIDAAVTAKAMGIQVIGLTGRSGGKLDSYADAMVKVPETETYLVQEMHLPIYHCWCGMLEEHFFPEK